MFCPNCGAKLPEDSVFCENCGTKVTGIFNAERENQPKIRSDGTKTQPERQNVSSRNQKKKGLPVPLLIGAAVIFAAIFFLLFKGKGNGNGGTDSPDEAPAFTKEENETEESKETKETEAVKETETAPASASAKTPQDSDSTADQGYSALSNPSDIAADLSTVEHALATDFEWFLDYELLGGEYQGQLVSDRSLTTLITKEQADLLQGGWKAYMYCADEGANPEDGARYFNAELHPAGDDFSVTMNWKYMFDAVSGSSIEETGSDLFKGNWNDDGTVSVKSDYAMVTFDTFLVNQDATAEYALGTFYWISGETYRIALMRVHEF